MSSWQSLLRSDPTGWLLEESNPSVRYYTLRDLLDLPEHDPQVVEAREGIMAGGPVPRILERQQPGGYWGKAEDFYIRAKYRGTVWNFILLAELGASGEDPRIRQACEFILAASQDRQSHGFAYQSRALSGGDPDALIPCLTGNMLFGLIRFGYLCDPRVQAGIEWLLRYLRISDGDSPRPANLPFRAPAKCWEKHSCHMGVVKPLKALAEIPPDQRSEEINCLVQMGAEYLLKHRIYMSSRYPDRVRMQRWLNFGFPLFYNTDALEILLLLTRLGYHDERMQPAFDYLLEKQDDQGRWPLETSFNDRMLVTIEQEGRPSKWITLFALQVIKNYVPVYSASSCS